MMFDNYKAQAVLAILLDQYEDDDELCLEPYVNCREQGFSAWKFGNNRMVAFSQDRNSDSIVVYFGHKQDFSMQGNVPDDHIYRNRKVFKQDEYKEAAIFAYKKLQ